MASYMNRVIQSVEIKLKAHEASIMAFRSCSKSETRANMIPSGLKIFEYFQNMTSYKS